MVYIERSITPYVQKAEKNFKAVLITGARQAGKSTLLKKLFPSRKYITFDDPFIEEQAIQNAGMFMTLNQPLLPLMKCSVYLISFDISKSNVISGMNTVFTASPARSLSA